MRAAIYSRVSTEEQGKDDKVSLDYQYEQCKTYTESRDWEVVKVYRQMTSGRKWGRLAEMLKDAEAKLFDIVVFHKLDRFGRSTRDILNAHHELQQYGVTIASVMDNIDTSTSMGLAMMQMQGVFAELDVNTIADRMQVGIVERVKAGTMYRSSTPPYGYRRHTCKEGCEKGCDQTKQIEIREDTATIVRRIYDMYVEGLREHAIASRLSELGIPVPSATTNRKNRYGWHKTTVRRILRSPVYVGRGVYWAKQVEEGKKVTKALPMSCPPIISEQLFAKVQEIAGQHSTRNQRNTKLFYLLQGLVYCGHCDSKYSSLSDGRGTKYYRCARRNLYGAKRGGHKGVKWAYRAEVLDDKVKKFVKDFMANPKVLLPHVQRQVETLVKKAEGLSDETTEMRQRLEELQAEEDRILNLAQKGLYKDEAQMSTKLDEVRKDQAAIDRKLKALTRKTTPVENARKALLKIHDQITKSLIELQVNDPNGEVRFEWADYPDKELKKVIRYLIDRVVVKDDGSLGLEGVLIAPGSEEPADFPLPGITDHSPP